jgi:sulfur-oxidizing protein SoxY
MTTRRDLIKATGALALGAGAVPLVRVTPAHTTPATMQAAIHQITGEAQVFQGKVTLDIPPLVENGNTVACSVTVDSPMNADEYVKGIHIFNEKNPQPNVISVRLGPRAGRARVDTRIRLADTQTVHAIAELSDGSFWSGTADVVITLGACLEDG